MTGNGLGLCAVWDLLHHTFNLAPMLIKGTNAEFTTSARLPITLKVLPMVAQLKN
jgi:hypothetical protein